MKTVKFPFNIPLFGYWKPHLFSILWKYKSVVLVTAGKDVVNHYEPPSDKGDIQQRQEVYL